MLRLYCECSRSGYFLIRRVLLAHRIALQRKLVSLMDEAVEDCVGESRVLQPGVPVFKGQLACDDRGSRADAIVEHFEQIVARALVDVLQSPVVEQQDVHLGELREPTCEAAVAVSDFQFLEQPRDAHIQHGEALSTGLLAEGAGDPCFSGASWPCQDEVLCIADPVTAGELGDDTLVEPTALPVLDVLNAGLWILEFRRLEQSLEPPGIAPGDLTIHDHAEAFLERQARAGRQRRLFLERASHAVQLERLELGEGLLHQHRDLLGSVVILGPSHVLVQGRLPFGGPALWQWLLVGTGLQDGAHRPLGRRANHECALARRFQPVLAVLARQRQQTQAGAVSHFRVRTVRQQMPDDRLGADADRCAPVQQPARGPFHVGAVSRRHMLGHGGVLPLEPTASVGGDALAAVQDFHTVTRHARVDFLTHKAVRCAVVMTVDLDVRVNVDAALLEGGDFVATRRQRAQCRFVEPLEPLASSAIELLERPRIQVVDQPGDRLVQFGQTVEPVIPEAGENPSFDDLYADLDLRLIVSQQLLVVTTVARP